MEMLRAVCPAVAKVRRRGSYVGAPEITVAVPAYNAGHFIGRTLASALSQTHTDFELVVLDNCSTDNTLQVARQFDDSRLRILQNESNLGAEGNWNRALAEARGRFVKILCADDVLYPDALASQRAVLLAPGNEDIVLVCSARDIIDEQDRRVLARGASRRDLRLNGREAVRRTVRAGTNLFGETSSALFRRSAQEKAGLFDASIPYIVDLDMWVRLLKHGAAYYQCRPHSAFRVSLGSWSMDLFGEQGRQFRAFIDRLRADPDFGLSRWDVAWGKLSVSRQVLMRRLFYKFFLGRRPQS